MNKNTHNRSNSMCNQIKKTPEEVLALIPWAAKGKLSTDDQLIFEEALGLYPSLKDELTLEKQMVDLVSADKNLMDKSAIAPTEERLKSVFNSIDSLERFAKATSATELEVKVKSTWVERLKSAVDSIKPSFEFKPQYAQFASVTVLVITVAVLASFIASPQIETSEFTPASAKTHPSSNQASASPVNAGKTILLVGYKGTSIELSNNVALKGKQMKIESPTDKDGFFQISFTDKMSEAEIKQTIDSLLAQEEAIWFAGEAF